uniref:Immunoglobulin V-set domain-containing protein n=1 Tax=Hucho hucho TaxID=62062 RepID=A0A4W5LKX4_9TELE
MFTNIHRPPPLVLPEAAVLSCRCSVVSVVSSGAYRVSLKTGGSTTIPCRYDLKYKTLHTDPRKSVDNATISDDINQNTFTVTMTDLEPEDSEHYWCALVLKYIRPLEKCCPPFTIPLKNGPCIASIYRGPCSKCFNSSTDGREHSSTCQKLVMQCSSSCAPSLLW